MNDADVVAFMKTAAGPVTVKIVVAGMKSYLTDARNKERLRGIMKRVLALDKATGTLTLKNEFQ